MRAAALVLVAVLGACQGPAGAQFRTVLTQEDGVYPMPVVLGDQTGLVTAIEPAPFDWRGGGLPSVEADPDVPNAVIVIWGTGACDDDTGVSFARTATGFRMDIVVTSGFNFGCTAQLLARQLRVRFSEAVPADAIEVFGGAE